MTNLMRAVLGRQPFFFSGQPKEDAGTAAGVGARVVKGNQRGLGVGIL